MQPISRTETVLLSSLSIVAIAILINAWRQSSEALYSSIAVSTLAFTTSYALIRWTGDALLAKGLKGRDMSKKAPLEM